MAIELQEFARQVLFGNTLEEKLSFPREEIVDTRPGDGLKSPVQLTRPDHLVFREKGERVAPPGITKLIDEKERGRLLHFFCNHELLATELMALALLKFPDAPASFRRGLLETLKEEQMHTQLYLHRMSQCGITFGELPLSDYFWKSVSTMDDPLDYVTRLSLTFEQANLDYSREYAKLFRTVGDETTSGILDKIYRDEINHVGFGLKWFRRWKAAGKTDWEAYRERLVFPLSPSRAKGRDFNHEGRTSAGFDERFINELQVYHQSRGRTPVVWWFNPDAEAYAARKSSENIPASPSALQRDLSFLPAYLARLDDLLILPDRPSSGFLKEIQSYGFPLPEMITQGVFKSAPSIKRKISAIRPWAWSPDSAMFFKKTFPSLTSPVHPDTLWNAKIAQLFSKSWSAEWGRQFAASFPENDWIAPAEVYGRTVSGMEDLNEARSYFDSLGYRNIVCKAPYAAAAKGNRCIMAGEEISSTMLAWLEGCWKNQGACLVEPWLDRVYDFSIQFEKQGQDMKLLAFTPLVNNARGQFRGIIIHGFCKGIDAEVARFLLTQTGLKSRVYEWYQETVGPRLASALDSCGFSGPLGIDAFAYRDNQGVLKLKTMVELNPRFTMGRIGYELGKHVSPRSVGCFQIISRSQIRSLGVSSFGEFSETLKDQHPVSLTDESVARIISGSFPLNDPLGAKQFLAVLHVRKTMGDIWALFRRAKAID